MNSSWPLQTSLALANKLGTAEPVIKRKKNNRENRNTAYIKDINLHKILVYREEIFDRHPVYSHVSSEAGIRRQSTLYMAL